MKLTLEVRQHPETNRTGELERGFTVQHMNADWCIQDHTTLLFMWTKIALTVIIKGTSHPNLC
jgi:hypothetical protein